MSWSGSKATTKVEGTHQWAVNLNSYYDEANKKRILNLQYVYQISQSYKCGCMRMVRWRMLWSTSWTIPTQVCADIDEDELGWKQEKKTKLEWHFPFWFHRLHVTLPNIILLYSGASRKTEILATFHHKLYALSTVQKVCDHLCSSTESEIP